MPDATPPLITILSPANNTTVAGTIALSASATDNVGVASVRFLVDGTQWGPDFTGAPYGISLDTTKLTNGLHNIAATARDAAGNIASATALVIVANTAIAVPDTVPPVISSVTPTNNSTVSGVITLAANASDNVGVAKVRFLLDGVFVGEAVTAPYQVTSNTATAFGGVHYLTAQAWDQAGNTSASNVSFTTSGGIVADCTVPGVKTFVGCYYGTPVLSSFQFARLDNEIGFDWGLRQPDASLAANSFSVKWLGSFAFDGGNYLFTAQVNGGMRLCLDNVMILDKWNESDYATYSVMQNLTPGTHTMKVEYHNGQSASQVRMYWQRQ